MTLEKFTHKTCYDYFQAYDLTLICSLGGSHMLIFSQK